jgi:(2R)-3-sulfolactate dehydrogenase (NADP+)
MTVKLTLSEVESLSFRALRASNTKEQNARSVALSVMASEADGLHSHGLARLPTYCEHARCGKIDGNATPTWRQVGPCGILVDACDGFAHPAIDLGLEELLPRAKKGGLAALAVKSSYNCGVVGYHMERIAEAGLVALGFVNAPASIAPFGGRKAVFGTNPIACAVPRPNHPPLVIDQSSSVVAKSEVIVYSQRGQRIPKGWALDREGRPTDDPKVALDAGTMVPVGGYKGANLALLVEIMAAGMTGASLGIHASSFADNRGGSPRTGQFFIAFNADSFAGPGFLDRMETLIDAAFSQKGAKLPGGRRLEARQRTAQEGVTIHKSLHEKLLSFCDV